MHRYFLTIFIVASTTRPIDTEMDQGINASAFFPLFNSHSSAVRRISSEGNVTRAGSLVEQRRQRVDNIPHGDLADEDGPKKAISAIAGRLSAEGSATRETTQ